MTFRGDLAKSRTPARRRWSPSGEVAHTRDAEIDEGSHQAPPCRLRPTVVDERSVDELEVDVAEVEREDRLVLGRVLLLLTDEPPQRVADERLVVASDAAEKPTVRSRHHAPADFRDADEYEWHPVDGDFDARHLDVAAACCTGSSRWHHREKTRTQELAKRISAASSVNDRVDVIVPERGTGDQRAQAPSTA